MSTENAEPIPVPPPAVAEPTDAPAPTEPALAEPTISAPSSTTAVAADPPAPEPEATPVVAAAATEPTPAPTETAPAPEPEVTPAPAAVTEVKEEESSKPGETAAADDNTPAMEPNTSVDVATTTKVEEQEEPQNALTRKFTDAEWKAVKELRTQLPSIFAKAYPDAQPAPESITLWGVPLSATAPDARASVILAKFARARSLNAAEAADMLVATLKWREEFKIEEVKKEAFDEDVFGKLGKVYGKDRDGRPVTYNLYGEVKDMKAVFGDVQKFIRWRVQFMEQSIELLDFETVDQMVQIHDYEGVSMTQRDASQKVAAKEATSLFQNHYPEFLSRKFFINVPTLLTWVFWLFKPLISANTLAKMSVVGTGAKTIGAELSQVIDVKELPKRYGGEAEAF